MVLTFEVDGLPPKKDGASSMWRKPSELPRLKALRFAASRALGDRAPFASELVLTIRLYADPRDGDLDNFITGICDGLMAASANTPESLALWADAAEVAPNRCIALPDDRLVQRIVAERMNPVAGRRRYVVELAAVP